MRPPPPPPRRPKQPQPGLQQPPPAPPPPPPQKPPEEPAQPAPPQYAPEAPPGRRVYRTGHRRREDKDLVIRRKTQEEEAVQLCSLESLPPSYDCSEKGLVGPVKDQGNCGSCWDFSGTAVVEGACRRAGTLGPAEALSEQYTLDCYRNGGCDGDDNTTVLDHAQQTGLATDAAYGAYDARPGACRNPQPADLRKIIRWGFADPQNAQGVASYEAIKQAIYTYGPVGAAIAADDAFMNLDPAKVFEGNSTSINHDITFVGWDDSKGSGGALRLRNSWGEGWGDKGYCWIAPGANEVGTEAVWADAGGPEPPPPPPPPPPPGPTSQVAMIKTYDAEGGELDTYYLDRPPTPAPGPTLQVGQDIPAGRYARLPDEHQE